MTIGNKIKNLRETRGWIQERLGAELNVTKQTISNWENDKTDLSVSTIIALCKVFGVTPNEILGVESDPVSVESDPVNNTGIAVVKQRQNCILNLINTDRSLNYLAYRKWNVKRFLKSTVIGLLCLALAFLKDFLGSKSSIILVAISFICFVIPFIPVQKGDHIRYKDIESGNFVLTPEARAILLTMKAAYQHDAMINAGFALLGIMGLALWMIDSYVDNGYSCSNFMYCIFILVLTAVISVCMPLAQHWHAIRQLLHETAPEVETPFHLQFWKTK